MRRILCDIGRRLAPFIALLDARYLPLLFAVAPQSFAVYRWLYEPGNEWIAILGALGYEMVYVGAIAWADDGTATIWTWITAFAALVFSVLVAVVAYWPMQRYAALLHAGFPIVAFCYTLQMHAASHRKQAAYVRTDTSNAPHITQAVQVNVASAAALPVPDAAPMLAVAAPMRLDAAHRCKRCGGAVASAAHVGSSVRWGCVACKEK